jgi:uncharacterized protein YbjT (DUF2867 family)
MPIAVVGATGTIGSRVTAALRSRDEPVRAVVRNRARADVLPSDLELALADLNRASEVEQAIQGVDRVVLIAANGPDQVRQEANVVKAAAGAGVQHLVKLSVGGAAADAPLAFARDHWAAEVLLREVGVPATIVRPGFFMQNLLQYADWVGADGTLRLPLGDAPIAMVDAADVAEVIAAVVLGEPREDVASLTGPAAITMPEAAEMLSKAAGRSVQYVDSDPEEYFGHLVADGYEEQYARDLTTLYDKIVRPGYAGVVSNSVQELLGHPPRTFADFASDNAARFKS